MNLKYIFYLIFLISSNSFSQASFHKNDAENKLKKGIREGNWVEYRDSLWNDCSKENAKYYHLVSYVNGIPVGSSGDYFLDDKLQNGFQWGNY